MLNNSRGSPRLGSYLPDDECDGVGCGVSMKAEALEPDLFQLRVYRRRGEGVVQTKVLPHHSL